MIKINPKTNNKPLSSVCGIPFTNVIYVLIGESGKVLSASLINLIIPLHT